MENDIWILDVNIIHHVGCFAILASTLRSDEAVFSRADAWWVQRGFIQTYVLHLSSCVPRHSCPVNWPSLELPVTGSSAGGDGPDGLRWPQPIDGCVAVQICRLGVFTSYIGFSRTAWRGSHCRSPSRNIGIESKTRWEEGSCQARVECHRCDEQGLNDFC